MKVHSLKCNKWLIGTLAVVGAAVIANYAVAEESYVDLQNRVAAAEAKIASMSAPSDLDVQRAEANAALVREILADADARAMLQGEKSPVTVNLHGFGIFRYQYNNGGGNSRTSGFNLPYERLEVSGKVYDWDYKVSGEFSDSNAGDFDLVDAYLSGSVFDTDVKVGQFVTSFYKGYTDSPLDNVTGEYSLIATTFGQGRSQGVEFSKDWGNFALAASYNDGFNTQNGAAIGTNGYGISVRGDYDFGSGFGIGAAYAYQDANNWDGYSMYTLDASYVSGNWNAAVSWIGSDVNSGTSNNYGLVGTLGYQCSENLQGFLQYEYGQSGVGNETLSLMTVGANYDVSKNVRWMNSVGYSMNAVQGWNTYRSGWNNSSTDGEFLVTTQLSVTF
jgi:hypothetical protein